MAYDINKILAVIKNLQEAGQSRDEIKGRLKNAGIDEATVEHAFSLMELPELEPESLQSAVPLAPEREQETKMGALIAKRNAPAPQASGDADEVAARVSAVLDEKTAGLDEISDSVRLATEEPGERLDSLKDAVEGHKASMEDLRVELKALHQNMSTLLEIDAKTFGQKLTSLERDLKEVRASSEALEDLMKKLLESNRDILKSLKK